MLVLQRLPFGGNLIMDCPKDGCDYEGKNRMAVGVHWSRIGHEGLPPWKEHTCDYCGESFERCESQLTEDGSFCSEECYGQHLSETNVGEVHPTWTGGQQTFTCDECGDEFTDWPGNKDGDHVFCTYECYASWEKFRDRVGYYGPDWPEIRQDILERDNHTCTYDGCDRTECQDGRPLHVHHIVPFLDFDDREVANRPENLRTLCAQHHRIVEAESKRHDTIEATAT